MLYYIQRNIYDLEEEIEEGEVSYTIGDLIEERTLLEREFVDLDSLVTSINSICNLDIDMDSDLSSQFEEVNGSLVYVCSEFNYKTKEFTNHILYFKKDIDWVILFRDGLLEEF